MFCEKTSLYCDCYYPHSHKELDLSFRIVNVLYKIVYFPSATRSYTKEVTKTGCSATLGVIAEDGNVLKNLEVAEVIIKTKKLVAVKSFNDVQKLGTTS